jgi:hypothetical protein
MCMQRCARTIQEKILAATIADPGRGMGDPGRGIKIQGEGGLKKIVAARIWIHRLPTEASTIHTTLIIGGVILKQVSTFT